MQPLCSDFKADSDGKRCVSYIKNGSCDRPDRFMCSEWERKNGHTPPYKNRYLSHSRLQLYGDCPLAFYRRYVDPTKPKGRPAAVLTFGKIVHKVLELVMLHHVKEEMDGPLDLDLALKFYHQEWEASYLCGGDLFEEGNRQIRSVIRGRGPVSHWDLLGVELGFEIPCEPAPIIGFIDLVERDPEVENGVIITDWKTGALPMPWDVDSNMQALVYDVAVRQLFPWAKSTRICFHHTRQGVKLWTTRTDEQRADCLPYFRAMGERTERDVTWEATPGAHCSWCSHRLQCEARRAFLADPVAQGTDLETVAAEHLALLAQKKVITARLRETEKHITGALAKQESIKAAGRTWSQWPLRSLTYPIGPTLEALQAAGLSKEEAWKALSVDKQKLARLLGKLPGGDILAVEIEVEAKERILPRLWAKK